MPLGHAHAADIHAHGLIAEHEFGRPATDINDKSR